MCMFCAAIPVTGAIGASLNNRQNATLRAAETAGVDLPKKKPIAKNHAGSVDFSDRGFGGLPYGAYPDLRIAMVIICKK